VTDNPSMTVVQRQSKALTSEVLYAEDPDNSPDEIVYDVINSPVNGRLVFAENLTLNIVYFTQADINRERVVYIHDGTLKTIDFYFRVSDGKFQPVHRHFRIHIIPLEIKLVNRTVIPIQQGTRMAYISSANMGVATNGQRSYTFYNVTHRPQGGQIFMNDAPASVFSQGRNLKDLFENILETLLDPPTCQVFLSCNYSICIASSVLTILFYMNVKI
jgi:hypothetical protein